MLEIDSNILTLTVKCVEMETICNGTRQEGKWRAENGLSLNGITLDASSVYKFKILTHPDCIDSKGLFST